VDESINIGSNVSENASRKGLTCLTCKLQFQSYEEQVIHFKSNYHYINMKRKMKNDSSLSVEEFEALIAKEEKEEQDEAELEKEKNQESDSEESSSDVEEIISESASSDRYHRYQYKDDKGQIDKVFHPSLGPLFNIQLNSLSPWQFLLNSAIFPRSSIFQTREWNLLPSSSSSASSTSFPLSVWDHLGSNLYNLQRKPLIAVFILRSGRFAGAIFNNNSTFSSSSSKSSLLVHKVVRRYTVRAKAGGGQSSHDNKGGKARSVGAMLRRYGEKALQEDIEDILGNWKDYLIDCSLILIASTKSMRYQLFRENDESGSSSSASSSSALLSRDDSRISFVPFIVDKPTLESIHIIREKAIQVIFHQNLDSFVPLTTSMIVSESGNEPQKEESSNKLEKSGNAKVGNSDKIRSEKETVDDLLATRFDHYPLTVEIFKILQSSEDDKVVRDCLQQFIQENFVETNNNTSEADSSEEDEEEDGENSNNNNKNYFSSRFWSTKDNKYDLQTIINFPLSFNDLFTPLHIASMKSFPLTIEFLLYHQGNPENLDSHSRTPYFLATNKATRDTFRKMKGILGNTTYDWKKTGIPLEITEELLQSQKQKEKEKKKKKQQKKKEKKVQAKEQLKSDEAFAKQLQEEEEFAMAQSFQQMEYSGNLPSSSRSTLSSSSLPPRPPATVAAIIPKVKCDFCQKEIENKKDIQHLFQQYSLCSLVCWNSMKRKLAADAAMNRFGSK
jgi:DNA-binding transcriptional MerR regulator